MKKLTTKEFIEKAREVHGDKYDYSKTEYIRSKDKVIIICPEHGEFLQRPNDHLSGYGCKKCGDIRKTGFKNISTKQFILMAKKIHGDKYDYSLVEYKNSKDKVIIICPEHGEFEITPNKHLFGEGCKKCSYDKSRLKLEEFIEKAREVHGDKYDYKLVNYKNNSTKIKIICPIHGEFWQEPRHHINQESGCPKCKSSKGEKLIRKLLIKNKIEFEEQYTFNECKNKNCLPFDFGIIENNKLKYLIEFQGAQHYTASPIHGGEKRLKQQKFNDKIKKLFCERNGIVLHEILYNENIEERINDILCKDN